jgi:hypothetical protein
MNTSILSACSLAASLLVIAPATSFAQNNTNYGTDALKYNTTGHDNSAFGNQTLRNNETGTYLTGFGHQSLVGSYHSHENTGMGALSVSGSGGSTVTGFGNAGFGSEALDGISGGYSNTATGYQALKMNGGGWANTAMGAASLKNNTLGRENTTVGATSMQLNLTGNGNTAAGMGALRNSTAGSFNTMIGGGKLATDAAASNSSSNTVHGVFALSQGSGNQQVVYGHSAMLNGKGGQWNTAIGAETLKICGGRGNIAIGRLAGDNIINENYNIFIGARGRVAEGRNIQIGQPAFQKQAYLAGVHNATSAAGVRVFVNASGKLGTLTSSRKFKTDIADMDSASEVLRKLRPVTFHYKPDIDNAQIAQFGLIAEEVADASPDLVARDEHGDIYTVRYEAVNAMLLNEFQKQHQRVKAQDAQKPDIKSQLEEQKGIIESQEQKLQELSRRATELMARMNGTTQKID